MSIFAFRCNLVALAGKKLELQLNTVAVFSWSQCCKTGNKDLLWSLLLYVR